MDHSLSYPYCSKKLLPQVFFELLLFKENAVCRGLKNLTSGAQLSSKMLKIVHNSSNLFVLSYIFVEDHFLLYQLPGGPLEVQWLSFCYPEIFHF